MTGPNGELPEALQKVEPAMLELVCNEIVEQGGHVQWNDIAGQEQAKRLVQELVVWPMLNPHLFKVSHCLAADKDTLPSCQSGEKHHSQVTCFHPNHWCISVRDKTAGAHSLCV